LSFPHQELRPADGSPDEVEPAAGVGMEGHGYLRMFVIMSEENHVVKLILFNLLLPQNFHNRETVKTVSMNLFPLRITALKRGANSRLVIFEF
jgi:hypothetical protein